MGALFSVRDFSNCSYDELKQNIAEECSRAGAESGHSGSGDWGDKVGADIEIIEQRFICGYSADAWLEDNTYKKGPIRAVKYLAITDWPETPAIQSIINQAKIKIEDLEFVVGVRSKPVTKGLVSFPNKALSQAKSDGSNVLCDNCGSNVSIAYVKSHACPVCSTDGFIYSHDDLAKLDALNAELDKARALLDELKLERVELIIAKATDEKDWRWMVGAMCEW